MADQHDIWHESAPKRHKKRGSRREESGGALNINSMMDIMVIILVFLLKSYGEEPLKVQDRDIKAPSSMAELTPKDMTTIAITQSGILVDDKVAVDVKRGAVDKSAKQGGDDALAIRPLQEKIVEAVERKKREKQLLGEEYKPTATIIADQSTPYRLITEVMYTAGQAQLSQFKIAVIKKKRDSFAAN